MVSAATAENEKSVVVLAGSILEGTLYTLIKGQSEYIAERRGTFQFNPAHGLRNYLGIFNRWLNDLLPTVDLPDSVVDYRDMVHINQELNFPAGICRSAAGEMLRILDSLLGALRELTAP